MEYKNYQQFRVGFGLKEIESDLFNELDTVISSNEPTVEIINGSEKFIDSLSDIIIEFIHKISEVQLDRKSNYVFIECLGSGTLHHVKATLSCKITKKTAIELKQEEMMINRLAWQKKHEESVKAANEKRRITREAKKALQEKPTSEITPQNE